MLVWRNVEPVSYGSRMEALCAPKTGTLSSGWGCHILSYSLPLALHFTCARFQSSYYPPTPNFQSCHNTRCVDDITETSSCTVHSHFHVFASHYTTVHVSALMDWRNLLPSCYTVLLLIFMCSPSKVLYFRLVFIIMPILLYLYARVCACFLNIHKCIKITTVAWKSKSIQK